MRSQLRKQQSNFVKCLEVEGPRIKHIARVLDQNAETVRYWFKKMVLGHPGFAFVGTANYAKLGLRRYVGYAEVARDARPFAKELFFLMYEMCGLAFYNKTLPCGLFDVQFNVPEDLEPQYVSFFRKLNKSSLFSRLELNRTDWYRRLPMKAQFFDFARGRWDFEWKAVEDEPSALVPEMERGRPPLDRQDMDIIVELQTNAAQSIVEISKQAKLEYYETFRHFRHVMRDKLVEYYRINWLGTGIRVRSNDPKLFSGFHHPHRLLGFTLRFNNLTNSELSHVASGLSKLPFIWSDQGGSGFYYAELNVPLEYYHEALKYVESLVWDLNEKFTFRVLDTTNATSFTIPNQLFDGAAKAWKFDDNAALSRLEKLVILTKQ